MQYPSHKRKGEKLSTRLLLNLLKVPFAFRLARKIAKQYGSTLRYRAYEKALKDNFSQGDDYRVLNGPFKGLVYPEAKSVESVWLPKLMGTYESELHHILEDVCKKEYPLVINIGAAEGYYAVGLAKRLAKAEVVAFEADSTGQNLCEKMAELNGVAERLSVFGRCDADRLSEVVRGKKGLIVCDCEGCELNLLRVDTIPDLIHYDLVVELHDFSKRGPTISQIIYDWFSPSHYVKMINCRYSKSLAHLNLINLDAKERRALASEGRKYSIGWVFLESKTGL